MKEISSCRVCKGSLNPVLSLGEQYISDFPLSSHSDGMKVPLDLVLCQNCHLLQLKHTIDGELFYRNYWYQSGTNQTMKNALSEIAERAETIIKLSRGDAVLDIGCNDGSLLSSYKSEGIFTIGFDPAKNLAQYSSKLVDKVIVNFFSSKTYNCDSDLSLIKPKIVTSIAMFYDLDDPCSFVSDVKTVMDPDGLWIIQMSYLPLMIKNNEIGNVCHEHLEYYSIKSLEYLLNLYDFEIVDIEMNDINGGSIRTYIRNKTAEPSSFGDKIFREIALERISHFKKEEEKFCLDNYQTYKDFAFFVSRIKDDVTSFIKQEVSKGKKIYVYGASTKGNTVLQYYELDQKLIHKAAERNPNKWGRVTVGTHIPIISEEEARIDNPDYFLVLPWHFADEFIEREKKYLIAGGRFILPAPFFTII